MRAHTGMHGPRPVPLGSPDVVVGPASILRQDATNAVSVWTDAWRGHKTTRGRGGSTIKVESRHPKVVSRATCAVGVPGALGRGGMAACKACAGQLCSCVHMVQRMTFRAHNVVRVLDHEDQWTPAIRA